MERSLKIIVTTDASGAQQAAREALAVVIVDVIDMSTTLESALDAGAYAVLGASPDFTRAPVKVSPEQMGKEAARLSREAGEGIIIVAEPRIGADEERLARCQKLIKGIELGKGVIEAVLPNIGAEAAKMVNLNRRVVVACTDTGGVAYDAAFQECKWVTTGTVARSLKQKGVQPALSAARRAVELAKTNLADGIAVVAASRNSMEDILAAQFIANLIMRDDNV